MQDIERVFRAKEKLEWDRALEPMEMKALVEAGHAELTATEESEDG